MEHFAIIFYPESERGVLLIAGVCYTSSHLLIFTSSSSHLHRSSSHLRIFIFTSTHLHIFTPSHVHIFTHLLSFCLRIFSSSQLLSCPLSLSLARSLPSVTVSLRLFLFSLFRPRGVPTRHLEMATLSHEMKFGCKKIAILKCLRQPFCTK